MISPVVHLVRAAEKVDAEAIARIYIEASIATLGDSANIEAIEAAAHGRHAMWAPLVRSDPDSAMDVLDDGSILGFSSVGAADGSGTRTGDLFALYVAPSAWGTGIGSRLLTSALEHLRGWEVTTAGLWVQEENTQARSFYERRDWSSTGEARANDRGNFIRYTTAL